MPPNFPRDPSALWFPMRPEARPMLSGEWRPIFLARTSNRQRLSKTSRVRRARSARRRSHAATPMATRYWSMFVLNPVLYKKLPYNVRDFRTLAVITEDPLVMEVHPSVPAKSVAEFVAYAKQNPNRLSFGSAGTGGVIHLAGELFKQMAGIEMAHVPYKGAAPALADLLAGNVQVMFDSFGTALPPLRAGSLRALGVSSAQRRTELPDVPTVAESGYPDYLVSVWFAIAVPVKVPDNIAGILKASLDRALDDDT